MSALAPAMLSFLLGHQKRSMMVAREALQLLSEEEPLLLPLPHEWALAPQTVEGTSILCTPELGGMSFQLASLGFHSWVVFTPPFFLLEMGLLDLVVFFLLIYLSPGAGLSISSGQTGWHIILTVARSFWKKIPVDFGKVFGGVRVFNHLPTIFSTWERKTKNSAQHIILSQTVSDQNSRMLERCLFRGFPLRSPGVWETEVWWLLCLEQLLLNSSLDEFLKAEGMERVGHGVIFTPFVKTVVQSWG